MKLGEIKAIIFSLDGGILDSQAVTFDSINKVIDNFSDRPQIDYREFLTTFQRPIASYLESLGIKVDKKVLSCFQYWESRFRAGYQTPLCLGAKDLIKFLTRRGVALGIADCRRVGQIKLHLERFGLHRSFSSIIFSAETKSEALKLCCRAVGRQPHEVAFIGDSIGDVADGRKIGVKVIGFANDSLCLLPVLEEAGAHLVIQNYEQLIPLFAAA